MLEKLGDNSLVVIKDEKIIFSSGQDRLRPVIMCIAKHKKEMQGAIVIDKVVGLAAAKLFVFARVDEIYSKIMSRVAVIYLTGMNIKFEPEKIVDKILNDDKSDICPMERLAESLSGKELFGKLNK